jgi:DNA polymerase III delta subunit
MLYAVYGAEGDKARAKKDALVASCRKQKPDAEFFLIESENFSEGALEGLYSSQGLFQKKHIVVLDRLLQNKELKDAVSEAFPKMAVSESMFILFDETIDAKTAALVKKHAKDVFVFGEKKEKKERDNTTFLITDAFMMKDRKSAWVNYQKAVRADVAPEAIHGALFWQVKTVLLAKKTGGWNKFAKNYSEDELDEILARLVKIYHDIRSEGGELEISLEKFLLGGY